MKTFWIMVPDHPDFTPGDHYSVRAKLEGFGHPPIGVEFEAKVEDWLGGMKYTPFTKVRLILTDRCEKNLGSKPVWNAKVLSGGLKPRETQKELFGM